MPTGGGEGLPVREYKTHFELWNERSSRSGDTAAAAARRGPGSIPRRARLRPKRILAIVMVSVPVAALAILLWMAARVSSRRVMVQTSPEAMPSVATSANEETTTFAQPLVVPPPAAQIEPAVMPSRQELQEPSVAASVVAPPARPAAATRPAEVAAVRVRPLRKPARVEPSAQPSPESHSADSKGRASQLAIVKSEILASSIRSELAREGLSDLGVSVNADDDVFLTGVVINRDDEGRAIAIARGHTEARDIYFSGGMWHEGSDPDEQPAAASAPPSAADLVSALIPRRATTPSISAVPVVSPDSPPSSN